MFYWHDGSLMYSTPSRQIIKEACQTSLKRNKMIYNVNWHSRPERRVRAVANDAKDIMDPEKVTMIYFINVGNTEGQQASREYKDGTRC